MRCEVSLSIDIFPFFGETLSVTLKTRRGLYETFFATKLKHFRSQTILLGLKNLAKHLSRMKAYLQMFLMNIHSISKDFEKLREYAV